jgi:hypothetical protein
MAQAKSKVKRQTSFLNNPSNKNLKAVPELSIVINGYEMRDLYHRQDRLAYWIRRINTDLQDPDRTDVLKLVEHMQDRERAILCITRCITAIPLIIKQLDKLLEIPLEMISDPYSNGWNRKATRHLPMKNSARF